jgi:hypothetical protein
MLQDSASPNAEFGLAVGDLGPAEREPKGEGETRYRALFIVELRTKRLLREIEPFRRPPSDPSPSYRADGALTVRIWELSRGSGEASAYINTPRQGELPKEYLFELEGAKWKLSRSN